MAEPDAGVRVLVLDRNPDTRRAWLLDVRRHLEVLAMLARKDLQTRYKRASLGIVWAVLLPLIQAAVLAVVFSRVIRVGSGRAYAIHVMAGTIAYAYFSAVTTIASTSIVDGTSMTEKVWFPRALLVAVPVLSNAVGLVVSIAVLLVVMPIMGVHYGVALVLLVPGLLLLLLFTTALSLCLAALHVYFRDVKFLVQAALTVWIYITPVIYSPSMLGRFADVVYANPLTGIVILFQAATGTYTGTWIAPIAVSVASTLVLIIVGSEAQRRHDRLFVDLL